MAEGSHLLYAALLTAVARDPLALVGIGTIPVSPEAAYALRALEQWPCIASRSIEDAVGLELNIDHAAGRISDAFGDRVLALCSLATRADAMALAA